MLYSVYCSWSTLKLNYDMTESEQCFHVLCELLGLVTFALKLCTRQERWKEREDRNREYEGERI